MSCGRITIGSEPDCENLPLAGTRARLILINFSQVSRVISSDDGIILSVELEPGARGYEFLGFRNDVGKREEVFKTKLKNRFRHSIGFVIYELDQLQKNNIRKITRGRFMAIVENKGKNETSVELAGRNVGLRIVEGQVRNAHENGGMFTLNLSTPRNRAEFEPKIPQQFGTSYENAIEMISAILSGSDLLTVDSNTITVDSMLYTVDQTIL
jgi:hypothetical protein